MNIPKYLRKDAFRSGPQTFEFCLCEKHRDAVDHCFDRIIGAELILIPVDEVEDYECYFCRGEDGPR